MRFIIHSKLSGTYLTASYGGHFYSGYDAGSFASEARTFPTPEAAKLFASEQLADDELLDEYEVLAVPTDRDFASESECVAAGAAPWRPRLRK